MCENGSASSDASAAARRRQLRTAGAAGRRYNRYGLNDLAGARATPESLAVSVAAPRLRREGVPVTAPMTEPEFRLYELLENTEGDLAHARYNALMRRVVSFADACRLARVDS